MDDEPALGRAARRQRSEGFREPPTAPKSPEVYGRPRCAACAAFPRLTHSFLEPIKGHKIRLYQCECGERIWDD